MKEMNAKKIMTDMERIKYQLEIIQNREREMFQEIVLQLGIKNDTPLIFMNHANSMLIAWTKDLTFEINLNKNSNGYILQTIILEDDEFELALEKIRRKQAKTIVQHMERIINDLPNLIQKRKEYYAALNQEREEMDQRYKEKIRQEVIVEMQNEKKQTKTHKNQKITMAHETMSIPILTEQEAIELYGDTPDF